MDNNNPGKRTWKYAIVKLVARTVFYLFYRKIHVTGQSNIPEGGSIIFAANHQNALMDALAVIMTNKYQPVYLARADIFKKPLIIRILSFLKIMPVYRIRDGIDTLGQNEDTFEKTTRVLASGGCIGIMPEGNHGEQKRLRLLKKGIFRIAFKAGETQGGSTDVKIVPVGLDYSNYAGFYEDLIVNYGKPISVSDYLDLYNANPPKGINAMKKDLSDSLSSLIIDVKDEENYHNDAMLVEIGSQECTNQSPDGKGVYNRFSCSKIFCQSLYEYLEKNPGYASKIRSKSRKLLDKVNTYGFSPGSMKNLNNTGLFISRLKRILCYPVFIIGIVLHLLPLTIIHFKLKYIKDPQFISSFKFVMGLLLVPLNYILLSVILFLFFTPAIAAILIVSVPVSGFIAYSCYQYSEKLREIIYYNAICRKENNLATDISELKSGIVKYLDPVFRNVEEKLK